MLLGVVIVFPPPKPTAKHQPVDLGIIATSKIKYRSSLFSATLDVLQGSRLPNHGLQSAKGHGKWGLEEVQLHHVGYAMKLFNQSWSNISKISVIKCRIKSECLGPMHVMHLNSILTSATEDPTVDIDFPSDSSVSNLADEEIIGQKDSQDILESLLQHKYQNNLPETPFDETLGNVSNSESENELLEILSSPVQFDKEKRRPEVMNEALLSMLKAGTIESRFVDSNNKVSDSQTNPVSNNEKLFQY